MTGHPLPPSSEGPPPVTEPLVCQRCGSEFSEGLREMYATLADGTTRWVSTCPNCLRDHPLPERPPYPDPEQPVRLKRIK